jgi:hypothetical protein
MQPPAPISDLSWIVATFERDRPLFLCRDVRRGHMVATPDPLKAERHPTPAGADLTLDVWRRHGHSGDWRVWTMTTQATFAEREA